MSHNHPSNMISSDNLTDEFIEDLHSYHNDPSKEPKYQAIREACVELFKVVAANCPRCADRTTALQLVRQVRMMANSSIALDKSGTES